MDDMRAVLVDVEVGSGLEPSTSVVIRDACLGFLDLPSFLRKLTMG
jgi:hypothetical protein